MNFRDIMVLYDGIPHRRYHSRKLFEWAIEGVVRSNHDIVPSDEGIISRWDIERGKKFNISLFSFRFKDGTEMSLSEMDTRLGYPKGEIERRLHKQYARRLKAYSKKIEYAKELEERKANPRGLEKLFG